MKREEGVTKEVDALSQLLSLSENEKTTRGILHTPAEIAQQPDTWLSTFHLFQRGLPEIREFLESAGLYGEKTARPTVFLIGAGTSDYVGQSVAHLLRQKWHCEVSAVPSTDLLTHRESLMLPGQNYLWISFSRSGDSPEGVAVLKDACTSHANIHHLVVTCNADARMLRVSSGNSRMLGICLDDTVNDRGLAMTSSFSNMVVFGQCLAHVEDSAAYEETLNRMVQAGRGLLPIAADCAESLAKDQCVKACFVGSGSLRAAARECALKLLELTAGKILTMSESALGLRHGPMAALDHETLFVCLLSGDPRVQQYERDLLEEIGRKRLVRTRIIVAGAGAPLKDSYAEHRVAPPSVFGIPDEYRPALDVIFGQLLGLFSSLRFNLKPDCPSPTGAISRVVQNVTIHS